MISDGAECARPRAQQARASGRCWKYPIRSVIERCCARRAHSRFLLSAFDFLIFFAHLFLGELDGVEVRLRKDMGNVQNTLPVMRDTNTWIRGLVVIILLTCALLPLQAQKVPVVEKHLANGMRLLLVERHDEPTIAGGWVAHVGSSNERLGITGIAHLFEHMMFKGTPTIGTKNYQKDLEIIAAQEHIRDQMREEEKKMRAEYRHGEIDDLLKPENKTPHYKELEEQFNKLIAEQREILVKNEFDRLYSGAGGSGMNALRSEED